MQNPQQQHEKPDAAARSLLAGFMTQMAIWALIIVIPVTAIGYAAFFQRAENETLATLEAHLLERGRTESAIFDLAQSNMEQFRKRFLQLYTDPAVLPDPDFDRWFVKGEDGAIRMRREYFTGVIGPDGLWRASLTGFMGRNHADLTPELKRRMVLTAQLLAEFGPAWQGNFVNTHASFPENVLLNYWPGTAWGLQARADLNMVGASVIQSTLMVENPDRRPIWTPLYHDHTANGWMVTYQLPVDHDGRHLINASHDVLLNELMDRLITDHLPGSTNFILSRDGHLIAHPQRMNELNRELGTINLSLLRDANLSRIHGLLRETLDANPLTPGEVRTLFDAGGDNYLAVTALAGPGWWFIAQYPRALVIGTAHQSASIIMLLGAAFLLAILILATLLLRRLIVVPLAVLATTAEAEAAGIPDHGTLPLAADGEIGRLARSLETMRQRRSDRRG